MSTFSSLITGWFVFLPSECYINILYSLDRARAASPVLLVLKGLEPENLLLALLRSLLSQGPHTLHMWSNPNVEEGAITYQADKLSTATNPDVDESVAISFLLDHYSFPVVLPSSLPPLSDGGRPSSPLTSISSPRSSSPHMAPAVIQPMDPGQAVHRARAPPGSTDPSAPRDCLRRFREESVLYGTILPHYFRNVDWMNRETVQDVHWLLGNCNPEELELTVALELLSMDFPDTMVRRLAVQRLESLSNEDVLKYLLQLVQVCTVITKECRNTTLSSGCFPSAHGCSVMSMNVEKWGLYIFPSRLLLIACCQAAHLCLFTSAGEPFP